MGDEHETQGQSRNNIIDDPSRVVVWQPANNGDFVDEVSLRGRRKGAGASSGQITDLIPGHVRPQVGFDAVNKLHGDEWQQRMPKMRSSSG